MKNRKRFTKLQGQYLAFIRSYERVHRVPPAESDLQRYFRVTPPAVHDMIARLDQAGLISRTPGQARSLRVRIPDDDLPPLGDARQTVAAARPRSKLALIDSSPEEPDDDEDKADSVDPEFPRTEVAIDCCGAQREFEVELIVTSGGYFVRATERLANGEGYLFAAHSETDPYLALGRLRQRIREGLATHYLARDRRGPSLSHHAAIGHIASDGVVIDGRLVTFGEFATLLRGYEGWQFSLEIGDAYDALWALSTPRNRG